jgi:sulfite reductase (ferredoxin)
LESTIEPLLVTFKNDRQPQETFGDFCHRVGFESLRQSIAVYQPPAVKSKVRHRIDMGSDLYQRLKAASAEQGKPMTELASAAIEAYLETL